MNKLEKHFIEKVNNPNIDFTGWVVCGKTKYSVMEEVYKTKSDYWLSEFMIAISGNFILVSPDCPEVYLVDTDKTILNMMDEITKDNVLKVLFDENGNLTDLCHNFNTIIPPINYSYATNTISTTGIFGSTGSI